MTGRLYRNEPLRRWRIIRHTLLAMVTSNPEHAMEVQHYRGIHFFIKYDTLHSQ